jgi:hypothetical protein
MDALRASLEDGDGGTRRKGPKRAAKTATKAKGKGSKKAASRG